MSKRARNAAHSPVAWLLIAIIGGVTILGFAGYGPFAALSNLPQPGMEDDGATGEDTLKTITVQGSVVSPAGAVPGAIGNAIFYDSAGGIVGSGALTASSLFSLSLPSGADYQLHISMASGNAPLWQQRVFQVSIPGYGEQSEVTAWTFPGAFIVYPKAVAWTERVTFGALGSCSLSYTAIAWGGTQTYTNPPLSSVNTYTTIGAGAQYTISIDLTATTAYSQLGAEFSMPNFSAYTVGGVFVLWSNRTDWVIMDAGSANAVSMVVNATNTIFVGQLPVVQSTSVAVTKSVNFVIMTPSAGQGQWGINTVFNTTLGWIQQTKDYKVNGPTGYGAVFYGVRYAIGHCG